MFFLYVSLFVPLFVALFVPFIVLDVRLSCSCAKSNLSQLTFVFKMCFSSVLAITGLRFSFSIIFSALYHKALFKFLPRVRFFSNSFLLVFLIL